MVYYQVYSHPLRQAYRTSFWSSATIVRLLGVLIIVIAPLLVAFRTHNFWAQTTTYAEQPQVAFKHQFILLLSGSTSDEFFVWSTFPHLNSLISDKLRVPVIRAVESDDNADGITDRFDIEVDMPLRDFSESVYTATLLLLFDYRLQLFSRFAMECALLIEHSGGNHGSKLTTHGDMRLAQRQPLLYRGRDTRFNTAVVDPSNKHSADAYSFRKIFADYASRNITTKFDPTFKLWTAGAQSFSNSFELSIDVRISVQTIERETGFWEILKLAWIQYFSVMAIFWFIVQRLWEFIFRHQLVTTAPDRPKPASAAARG